MSHKKNIEDLLLIIKDLSDSCNKNIESINCIRYILDTMSKEQENQKETQEETQEEEEEEEEEQIPNLEEHIINMDKESERILNRRIELHKSLGTYSPINHENHENHENHKEKPSLITPLSKLSIDTRDTLLRQLFKDAIFNVEKLMNIDKSDSSFKSKVNTEADRLLNVWIESHSN